MPDADFLTNTGHDFFIVFVFVGIVVIVKFVDLLLSGHIKNNKVSNAPDINSEDNHNHNHKNKDISINN